MDRVRFGRALGFGVRQAAKTVVRAMDAAMAESPAGKPARPRTQSPAPARGLSSAGATATQKTSRAVAQVREVNKGVRRGSKRFGEAVWGPVARLSGVLWLEVTGVFFGLFALVALGEIWRLRGAWHATAANLEDRRGLLGAMAMLGVFGYFCVSSFVRARRRERRR
jgi:hypothetical protein